MVQKEPKHGHRPSAFAVTSETEQRRGGGLPVALGLQKELRSERILEVSQHFYHLFSEPTALGSDAEGQFPTVLPCHRLGWDPFHTQHPEAARWAGVRERRDSGRSGRNSPVGTVGMGGRCQQGVPREGEPVGEPHAHQIYLLGGGEGLEPATPS